MGATKEGGLAIFLLIVHIHAFLILAAVIQDLRDGEMGNIYDSYYCDAAGTLD